jgi:prevent-host-death family protein
MLKTVNAVKARQNLGQLINEVYLKDDQYIIERDGKPMVALVPLKHLERWLKQKEKDFEVFEQIRGRNKKVKRKKLEKDVILAIQAIRRTHAS